MKVENKRGKLAQLRLIHGDEVASGLRESYGMPKSIQQLIMSFFY
jgi:hypothetical protein